MGAEEHKQWCDYRRIFLASRFACALVYRAGPANPPVLQAKHFESVKSLSLSFNIHVLTALDATFYQCSSLCLTKPIVWLKRQAQLSVICISVCNW